MRAKTDQFTCFFVSLADILYKLCSVELGSAFKVLLGMLPFLSALTGCLKGSVGQGPNT